MKIKINLIFLNYSIDKFSLVKSEVIDGLYTLSHQHCQICPEFINNLYEMKDDNYLINGYTF